MTGRPSVEFLSGGSRLHLQHGPIDLIIGADGDRFNVFFAAQKRFETVLQSLADNLPELRLPMDETTLPMAFEIGGRMHRTAQQFEGVFLTRMICVAGAVADTVLDAMRYGNSLDRAYVNNGGDIALHLSPGTRFETAIIGHDNQILGSLSLTDEDGVGGIATSGRHGRSQSMGIADAVTVLASDATMADAAATLIANEVDLPGHSMVRRQPANQVNPDSDLGSREVVVDCGALTKAEIDLALDRGGEAAQAMMNEGKIIDAALFLQGSKRIMGNGRIMTSLSGKTVAHA